MTRRCDSNPAQYERNRRFGHLVHVLGRSAGGARLPSAGLCLNASKAESRLGAATMLSGPWFARGRIVDSFHCLPLRGETRRRATTARRHSLAPTSQGGGPKSSADDLCTGRGVVLGRAATTLRSIETQPFRLDDLSCRLDKSSLIHSRGAGAGLCGERVSRRASLPPTATAANGGAPPVCGQGGRPALSKSPGPVRERSPEGNGARVGGWV